MIRLHRLVGRKGPTGALRGNFSILGANNPLFPDTREEFQYLKANYALPNKQRPKEAGLKSVRAMINQLKTYKERRTTVKTTLEKYKHTGIRWNVFLERIKDRLIIDEETGFVYGLNFDDYIKVMKGKAKQGTVDFDEDIYQIFSKLGYMQKEELIFLHRYVVTKDVAKNFKEKAKRVILEAILAAAIASKNPRKGVTGGVAEIENMLDHDTFKSIVGIYSKGNLEAAAKRLSELTLPEDKVESVAIYLAKEQVKNNLRQKARDRIQSQNHLYKVDEQLVNEEDPFFGPLSNSDSASLNAIGRWIKGLSEPTLLTRNKEFDDFIREEIHTKYFENKIKLLKSHHIIGQDDALKPVGEDNGLQQFTDEITDSKSPDTSLNYDGILDTERIDLQLRRLERRLRLVNKDAPTYDDLMMKVDEVIGKMPDALQNIFHSYGDTKESPTYALEVDHNDLLWKDFGMAYEKIKPRIYNADEESSQVDKRSAFKKVSDNVLLSEDDLLRRQIPIDEKESDIRATRFDEELRKFDPELQVSSVEASIGNLDVEQQKELQLYSLIDNQPFFKHYVQEVLRLNQDMGHSLNEKGIDIPLKMHYLDYFANDRPNIHLATQNRYQVKNSANHLRKDADGAEYVQAKGSRKTSRAVVRITPGSGKIVVNKRDFIEYFAATQRFKVCLPLTATMTACDFNIDIRTWGGGVSCQADACSVAISKALSYYDANYRPTLMKHGFLWVDYRQVERKKTGLYKARRKWTYKRR